MSFVLLLYEPDQFFTVCTVMFKVIQLIIPHWVYILIDALIYALANTFERPTIL